MRALYLSLLLTLLLTPSAQASQKVSDKNLREFIILEDGVEKGTMSFRWATSAAGGFFGFSNQELKSGRTSHLIRTHLQARADRVMEKYKKWIGRDGAEPELIAFWKDPKVRVVRKGKGKFTKNLQPPATFVVVDPEAGYLHQETVRLLFMSGMETLETPVLLASEGRLDTVKAKKVGPCLMEANGKTLELTRVAISGADTLELCVENSAEIWWMSAKGREFVRKGARMLSPGERPSPSAPEADQQVPQQAPKPLPDEN
jgi:hypothetical protein